MIKDENRYNPMKAGDQAPHNIKPLLSKPKILRELSPKQSKEDGPKITDVCFNCAKFKTQLASIDVSGVLKLWDISKGNQGKVVQQFNASKTWLTSVDIEKTEGKKIATGTLDGKLLIFDINGRKQNTQSETKSDKPLVEMMGHSGAIQCTQFLNQQYIIAGSTDSLISLWDIDSPQRYLAMHQQHTGDVLTLRVFPGDPNIFLSGSSDLTAKIWDIRVKKPMQQEFKGHESAVNCCRFLPFADPTSIVTASDDATINLWDLRMKKNIVTFQDYKFFDGIYQIAISPSGRYIFAATENQKLKVFDVLGETDVHSYITLTSEEDQNEVPGLIKCVDISSDGFCLAAAVGSKGNHKDIAVIF